MNSTKALLTAITIGLIGTGIATRIAFGDTAPLVFGGFALAVITLGTIALAVTDMRATARRYRTAASPAASAAETPGSRGRAAHTGGPR